MEDTLGAIVEKESSSSSSVLILVLMEDTLGVNSEPTKQSLCHCLNPCFNGRYSRRGIVCLLVRKNNRS